MTEKEEKLIEIVKEVLHLNKNNDVYLTLIGSLMLALRGIDKPREANDIDFICNQLVIPYDRIYMLDEFHSPIMPEGFSVSYDGLRSQPDAIQYYNPILDIKIDLIPNSEPDDCEIDGIPCAEVGYCLSAKEKYCRKDTNYVSREKHKIDIEYIESNNTEEKLYYGE